jgi:hypothetical protein
MFTRNRRLLVVVSGLFVAACSDTGVPSEEEAQVDLDVAAYAADAAVDDINLMHTEAGRIMGSAPFAAPAADELTITRTVTFFDADGNEMDAYDALNTASVRIVAHLEGSRSRTGPRGTLTVSINRDRDFTVSGLLGQETHRTWDGTGSTEENRVTTSDEFGERTYDMSATTEVDAVVIPVPKGSGWPLSGTITRVVTVEVVSGLEDTRTRTRTVVIEFNGTQFVPITINGVTYTLDLETRQIVADAE